MKYEIGIGIGGKIWKGKIKKKIRMIGHNLRYPGTVSFILEGVIERKN